MNRFDINRCKANYLVITTDYIDELLATYVKQFPGLLEDTINPPCADDDTNASDAVEKAQKNKNAARKAIERKMRGVQTYFDSFDGEREPELVAICPGKSSLFRGNGSNPNIIFSEGDWEKIRSAPSSGNHTDGLFFEQNKFDGVVSVKLTKESVFDSGCLVFKLNAFTPSWSDMFYITDCYAMIPLIKNLEYCRVLTGTECGDYDHTAVSQLVHFDWSNSGVCDVSVFAMELQTHHFNE